MRRIRQQSPVFTRGLALLELLVVIAIAGGAFAASLTFAAKAMHVNARAHSVAKATVLAQNELEFWTAQTAERVRGLQEGQQKFANPAAALPENAADATTLTVRRVEPGVAGEEHPRPVQSVPAFLAGRRHR